MTLKAAVLPLSQIDTSLVNVSRYVSLLKQASKIKSQDTRERVQYVIDAAYENANDTCILEGESLSLWDNIFLGTLGGVIVDELRGNYSGDGRAKLWFAVRGIQG